MAAKCKPCAERGRRLRIQQIREGWHPTSRVRTSCRWSSSGRTSNSNAMPWPTNRCIRTRAAQVADLDAAIVEVD
ncbi:hypothetical protein [Solwaraspora sp. WMMD406]|uniref:hypothetical protein n=1 Tax=Solwaraspora sp. WMMD406 TaxID=3016095 RepID=UPI003242C639